MTSKLPSCRPKDLEQILYKIGFTEDRQRGSHRIFIRKKDKRRVVLPMHNKDLKPGMLHQTMKDMGLTRDEFQNFLLDRRNARLVA